MNPFQAGEPPLFRQIRETTRILRKPFTGIISGYHKLPYILIGPDRRNEKESIEIRGRIHVSPKLILTQHPDQPTFEQLFEKDYMSEQLVGRVFSFLFAQRPNVKIQSEDLKIERRERDPRSQENTIMDEIFRKEITDTGVIGCPNIAFYPISLERFISEILNREMGG